MPQINEYPESTNPSGNWFVVVDDGTGCYKKVKISNLPGGSTPTTSTTTTSGSITTSTTTTAAASTTTSTTTAAIVPTTTTTSTTVAYDPDAIAFFAAAGITSLTQKAAVNSMVLSMKADGLWTKMKAIYPFVGGTGSSHAVNLKVPGTFNITFNGTGWTHNGDGVKGNGSTSYGDTGFNPSAQTMAYSMAYGVYSRENPTIASSTIYTALGSYDTVPANSADYLSFEGIGGVNAVTGYITGTAQGVAYSPALSLTKLFVISRIDASSLKLYKEAVVVSSDFGTTTGAQPNYNMYLSAANNTSTAAYFSPMNFAFAFISTGLADGEVASLNTIVNTFQTTLGRAV